MKKVNKKRKIISKKINVDVNSSSKKIVKCSCGNKVKVDKKVNSVVCWKCVSDKWVIVVKTQKRKKVVKKVVKKVNRKKK